LSLPGQGLRRKRAGCHSCPQFWIHTEVFRYQKRPSQQTGSVPTCAVAWIQNRNCVQARNRFLRVAYANTIIVLAMMPEKETISPPNSPPANPDTMAATKNADIVVNNIANSFIDIKNNVIAYLGITRSFQWSEIREDRIVLATLCSRAFSSPTRCRKRNLTKASTKNTQHATRIIQFMALLCHHWLCCLTISQDPWMCLRHGVFSAS